MMFLEGSWSRNEVGSKDSIERIVVSRGPDTRTPRRPPGRASLLLTAAESGRNTELRRACKSRARRSHLRQTFVLC